MATGGSLRETGSFRTGDGTIRIAKDRMHSMSQVAALTQRVVAAVERVVIGKREAITSALCALLAEGHVLIEDAPGVAKTQLVKSLSRSLGLDFRRVQCTPDLLPSDVTGASVFNPQSSEFTFRPGPIFANIVLVDELNRATPRTQSALLECMAEGQVSADGQTYPLDRPFLVFATQNPFEFEGTFPLPEAQLDRFAMRMRIGYPTEADEISLLERQRTGDPLETVPVVVEAQELLDAQAAVREVYVHEEVRRYLARLVRATRSHADVQIGASPRASLILFRLGQASAAMSGTDYVAPEMVRALAPRVLEHRLTLKPEARMRGIRPENVVAEIIERTPIPGGR